MKNKALVITGVVLGVAGLTYLGLKLFKKKATLLSTALPGSPKTTVANNMGTGVLVNTNSPEQSAGSGSGHFSPRGIIDEGYI